VQVKYLALDIHEENKWKKGYSSVISNQIATKVKKTNRKKKLDELYKRCMCLYLSMNINNNLTDISLGNENKNMTEQLNSYIKTISNVDYLSHQFSRWKKTLSELKSKLEKTFGEQKMKKAGSFFKVLNLMEDMIKMQEETIKYFNTLKEKRNIMDVEVEENKSNKLPASPNNLSNFIADIDFEMNYNKQFEHSANRHLYTEYLETTFNELDLNKISKEINDVIDEIVNEINNNVNEQEILLNSDGVYIASSEINVDKNYRNHNKGDANAFRIAKYSNGNIPSLEYSPRTSSENEIIFHLNPKQLFYDYNNSSNNETDLKFYLERLLKIDKDKIDIMPRYNYKKIAGSIINLNLETDEYYKSFMKIFPPIYFSDKTVLDKKMLESEIEIYKIKHEKVLGESELLNLFNLKFNNFTTIQKLILIWAICTYGTNMNILSEIPNIFTFTKSLNYDTEEIFVYLDKTMDSLNVDLLASNFDSLNFSHNTIQTKSDHYIKNYEPPMLNSTHCDFAYNKILYDYVNNYDIKSLNYTNPNTSESNCYFGLNSSTNNLQNSQNKNNSRPIRNSLRKDSQTSAPNTILGMNSLNSSSQLLQIHSVSSFNSSPIGISLIYYSPVLKTSEMKKFMYKSLKENIKKVCDLVNDLYNNNNINFYNYETMTRNTKPLKKNISQSNSTTAPSNLVSSLNGTVLKKADLMQQLNNSKIDFSANEISKNVIDETRPTLSKEILEGVSFYSQNSINREWEYLRSPWYQNNIQFKPKFRKSSKIYK